MADIQYLHVGVLVGAHGIHGEARIYTDTDYPEVRFTTHAKLLLQHPLLSEPLPLTVVSARPHKRLLLVQFAELTSREQVTQYREGQLLVPSTDIVETEADEYYYHQIVGCEVVTQQGEQLGKIEEILPYPANDVWVVRSLEGDREWLIPYIDQVVQRVDVDNQRITIIWMEGLESSG